MADEVSVADARAYLNSYAPDPAALEGMEETQLRSYYTRVSEATTKAADEAGKKAIQGRVPEKYELKLPEKTRLPESEVDRISTMAREKGLSNDEAQLLLDERHSAVEEVHTTQQDMLKQMQTEWKETVNSDPDMGGDKKGETERLVELPRERFMDDDLRTFLKETGYESHPAVVRFLRKLGSAMDEDTPPSGKGSGLGGAGTKEPQNVLYDHPSSQ